MERVGTIRQLCHRIDANACKIDQLSELAARFPSLATVASLTGSVFPSRGAQLPRKPQDRRAQPAIAFEHAADGREIIIG
jgi:hypothetical protein